MFGILHPRRGAIRPSGKQVFSFTGADQTFVVPDSVSFLKVKLWGAGAANQGTLGSGGGGGYTTGRLRVTPGETLTIIVGQGGVFTGPGGTAVAGYGGGGIGNPGPTGGAVSCNGGGRSAIRRGATELATAGGGGGGQGGNAGSGGAGGGTEGLQGDHNGTHPGGGGGTQAAGGAASGTAGSTSGSQFTGGQGQPSGINQGSGGGGGYYGGGGGGECNAGGGSGYIGGLDSGSTTAGAGATPPATDDEDYVADVGVGRSGSNGSGNHGRVVIIW